MAQLVWNDVGDRLYEVGVDRGVLYLTSNAGVVWNGLISVSEDVGGNTTTALYYDGIKYLDLATVSDFSGTIKAYTYPDEFLEFEGILEISDGVYAVNQNRKPFGLCYRTLIGDDVSGLNAGYKLHILYGLTALPQLVEYATQGEEVSPVEFSWSITGKPQAVTGFRPTSHIILDSRYVPAGVLSNLESILYGTTFTQARLPAIAELLGATTSTDTIVITDNGNGTWTATGPDTLITLLNSTTFQITEANATFIDANTYQVSSS